MTPNPLTQRRTLMLGGAATLLGVRPAWGQTSEWKPAKPIRMICSQAPGASTDATARALAEYFSGRFGVPVTVENKPGGVGLIAGEAVARSPTDGLTLLVSLNSVLAQAPVLLKKPIIDPDKNLLPIASVGVGPIPAVVHKDFPAKTIREVIARSKTHSVNVGNYAVGSGWQIMLDQLMKTTGAQFNVVNYKGTGAMIADLYAGHIDMGAGSLAGLAGGLDKGLIKPVQVIFGARSSRFPGVGTWADAGFRGPAFEDLLEFNLLMAPQGTPQKIIDALGQAVLASVTESPRVQAVRQTLNAEDTPMLGAELKDAVMRSWTTYRRLSLELGLSPE